MKEIIEILQAVSASLVSICGVVFLVTQHRREHFRTRLERTTRDCIALVQLEAILCDRLALKQGETAEAVKRSARRELRKRGEQSPSDRATLLQLERQLERL